MARRARQLPGGRALLLQACHGARGLVVDVAGLELIRQHVEDDHLDGDARCAVDALPWETAAFQLVVVQHAGEGQLAGALTAETARVLAPGGSLLWFGFNPWSPWLAGLRWRTRHRAAPPRAAPAERARRSLRALGLVAGTPLYLGPCWPRHGITGPATGPTSVPLRAAYLIDAVRRPPAWIPPDPRRVGRIDFRPTAGIVLPRRSTAFERCEPRA